MQVILVNDNSDDWEIVKEVERKLRWLISHIYIHSVDPTQRKVGLIWGNFLPSDICTRRWNDALEKVQLVTPQNRLGLIRARWALSKSIYLKDATQFTTSLPWINGQQKNDLAKKINV